VTAPGFVPSASLRHPSNNNSETETETMTSCISNFDVQALRDTAQAISNDPALGATTFSSTSSWQRDSLVESTIHDFRVGGAACTRSRAHRVVTDLPPELFGGDQGATPLELALSGLTACITTTTAVRAAAAGVILRSLRVDVEGDLDLRPFLDVTEEVRVGFQRVRLVVRIDVDLPEAEAERFVREAVAKSPVVDLFQLGTEVVVQQQAEVAAG